MKRLSITSKALFALSLGTAFRHGIVESGSRSG